MGRADEHRQAAPVEPDEAAGNAEAAEPTPAAGQEGAEGAASDDEDVGQDASAPEDAPDADTGPEPASGEVEEIQARASQPPEELAGQLIEAERDRDQYLDLLRRERAEFENFRRRANRERSEALDRGAEGVAAALLGVLDNFGFVLDAAERSDDTQLSKGVSMVHDELLRALEEAGLERVPGEGTPFDPNHHDAMMQVEAEEEVAEPTVVEVLRPGYRFKGRVLRPASVSVAQ